MNMIGKLHLHKSQNRNKSISLLENGENVDGD